MSTDEFPTSIESMQDQNDGRASNRLLGGSRGAATTTMMMGVGGSGGVGGLGSSIVATPAAMATTTTSAVAKPVPRRDRSQRSSLPRQRKPRPPRKRPAHSNGIGATMSGSDKRHRSAVDKYAISNIDNDSFRSYGDKRPSNNNVVMTTTASSHAKRSERLRRKTLLAIDLMGSRMSSVRVLLDKAPFGQPTDIDSIDVAMGTGATKQTTVMRRHDSDGALASSVASRAKERDSVAAAAVAMAMRREAVAVPIKREAVMATTDGVAGGNNNNINVANGNGVGGGDNIVHGGSATDGAVATGDDSLRLVFKSCTTPPVLVGDRSKKKSNGKIRKNVLI